MIIGANIWFGNHVSYFIATLVDAKLIHTHQTPTVTETKCGRRESTPGKIGVFSSSQLVNLCRLYKLSV